MEPEPKICNRPKRGQIWSYRALDTTIRNLSTRSTRWAWFQHFPFFRFWILRFWVFLRGVQIFWNRPNRNRRNRILKPNRWNRNRPYQKPNRTEPNRSIPASGRGQPYSLIQVGRIPLTRQLKATFSFAGLPTAVQGATNTNPTNELIKYLTTN